MSDFKVNLKYKDRLFRFLFGDEKNKAYLLELYNALNGTTYTDVSAIEITTLEDVIYMKMKNDLSFIVSSQLHLYEQQSTVNPNMPFREFQYCAKLYNKYVEDHHYDVYSSKLLKFPSPQCYVFYNGIADCPERATLRLSDAFMVPVEGYEWTTNLINIREGYNEELLSKCEALKDYSDFVSMVQKKLKEGVNIETAIKEVIELFGKEHRLISEFLLQHEAEVSDMCITSYNEEEHLKNVREEGLEEGVFFATLKFLDSGIITLEQALKSLNMSEEQWNKRRKELLANIK